MTATSPTYDVAMTDVDKAPVPEEKEGLYAECSMASLDNTYAALEKSELQQETEQVYMNAGNTARKTASKTPKKHTVQLSEVNSAIYQELSQNISTLKFTADQLLNLHPGLCADLPASSCAALLPTTPSGYYWVSASNGSAVRVYCDMTRSCGGVTGGWVRVGYLDMTNSSHQCPSGFTEHSDSNIRTCRRRGTSAGCGSVMMDSLYQFSRVCGRVRAYQISTTDAFQGRSSPSIDSAYVDGVSLTRGSPRQHIWTLAAGIQKDNGDQHASLCPCNGGTTSPPAFVGDDNFCDSGNPLNVRTPPNPTVYSDDPLWDGDGCGPTNTCCSFNTPPWFHKQLSDLTTDDIEMRVCTDEDADNENVDIDIVEIYVQ